MSDRSENGSGIDRRPRRERCVVVHPDFRGHGGPTRSADARLEEAAGLARAIDLDVVHQEIVPVVKARPSTLIGSGAIERLAAVISPKTEDEDDAPDHADEIAKPIVVVDAPLSPVQQRNLEKAWKTKVLDRTGLILEIFGARARTREGRLQVELAQCTYQLGRLVRTWTHLERQRGGAGFLAGPGETQIETDRRLIRQKIDRLKKDLKDVERTRELHRNARRRVPHPVVALVGYTNAGKSTLFNRLTAASVVAKDQLFATLDPTMRGISLPSGRRAILSDTVGFVSNLPHELVNAFHATLEEVVEADVIVHVRDIAHEDTEAQRSDVLNVLAGLDVADDGERLGGPGNPKPLIEALNKVDLLAPEDLETVTNRARRTNAIAVPISAVTGQGVDELMLNVDGLLSRGHLERDVHLGYADGAALAWLHEHAEVLARRELEDELVVSVRIAPEEAARFQATFGRPLDVTTAGSPPPGA